MKFIQLSTIAALAIFATAPGVSAAGLRAGGDKTEEASGRRSLYVKFAGPQGGPTVGPLVGPINTPGFGGMGMGMGMGGPRVDFNDNSESQYYNGLHNNPGRVHAYAYASDNDSYDDDDSYDDAPRRPRPTSGYAYGRAHSRGHGGDVEAYCSKFKTRQACHAHDHDQCGWDDSRGCHSY